MAVCKRQTSVCVAVDGVRPVVVAEARRDKSCRETGEEVEQKARCWWAGSPLRIRPCRVAEQAPLRRNMPGSAVTTINLRDTAVHLQTIGLCLAPSPRWTLCFPLYVLNGALAAR